MSPSSPLSPGAFTQPSLLRQALSALGELLAADDTEVCIIVVGGASLNMLGLLTRSTNDVDVLAFAEPRDGTSVILTPPEPLPPALVNGIRSVARDLQLPADWMNTEVATQDAAPEFPTLIADAIRHVISHA